VAAVSVAGAGAAVAGGDVVFSLSPVRDDDVNHQKIARITSTVAMPSQISEPRRAVADDWARTAERATAADAGGVSGVTGRMTGDGPPAAGFDAAAATGLDGLSPAGFDGFAVTGFDPFVGTGFDGEVGVATGFNGTADAGADACVSTGFEALGTTGGGGVGATRDGGGVNAAGDGGAAATAAGGVTVGGADGAGGGGATSNGLPAAAQKSLRFCPLVITRGSSGARAAEAIAYARRYDASASAGFPSRSRTIPRLLSVLASSGWAGPDCASWITAAWRR
jgi:hypothetical protein